MDESWPLEINFDTASMEFEIEIPTIENYEKDIGRRSKFAFVAKIWNKHIENTNPITIQEEVDSKENELTRRRSLDFLRRRRRTSSGSPLLQRSQNRSRINLISPTGIKEVTGKWYKSESVVNSSSSTNLSNLSSVANISNHSDSSLFDSFTSSRSSLPRSSHHSKLGLAFEPCSLYSQTTRQSYSLPLKSILKNRNENFAAEYESVKKSDMVDLEEFLQSFELGPQDSWNELTNNYIQEPFTEFNQINQ